MPPDRLVQTLLANRRVGRLLVADPYRSALGQVASRLLPNGEGELFPTSANASLIRPLRWTRREVVGEKSLRRNYKAYDQHLREKSQRMGFDRPAVITTNPFYAGFAPLEWAGPVTYYAWDDWAALAQLAQWKGDIEAAYELMARRGVRICAVSEHLLSRIGSNGPGSVVPNGIVPAEWQPPWRAPAWLANYPSPRILYAGSIHERLDIGAICSLSEDLPDASILIVGPVANFEIVEKLRRLHNVHIEDPLPHSEVPGLMANVDVCIMPHHRTALTESMSPLKIYEYCATGRPVVATDLAPVRNIHQRVRLVPVGGRFAPAVRDALSDDAMIETDRQSFLQQNSWSGRHEQILDLALQ
jgi:teichuronic acid biosynthesis glycosyltransferase TuaH